jgi:hypothetical protein
MISRLSFSAFLLSQVKASLQVEAVDHHTNLSVAGPVVRRVAVGALGAQVFRRSSKHSTTVGRKSRPEKKFFSADTCDDVNIGGIYVDSAYPNQSFDFNQVNCAVSFTFGVGGMVKHVGTLYKDADTQVTTVMMDDWPYAIGQVQANQNLEFSGTDDGEKIRIWTWVPYQAASEQTPASQATAYQPTSEQTPASQATAYQPASEARSLSDLQAVRKAGAIKALKAHQALRRLRRSLKHFTKAGRKRASGKKTQPKKFFPSDTCDNINIGGMYVDSAYPNQTFSVNQTDCALSFAFGVGFVAHEGTLSNDPDAKVTTVTIDDWTYAIGTVQANQDVEFTGTEDGEKIRIWTWYPYQAAPQVPLQSGAGSLRSLKAAFVSVAFMCLLLGGIL